jgi:hypothetical protein
LKTVLLRNAPRETPSKVMKSSKESVKRAVRKYRDEERLLPQFLIYHRQRVHKRNR